MAVSVILVYPNASKRSTNGVRYTDDEMEYQVYDIKIQIHVKFEWNVPNAERQRVTHLFCLYQGTRGTMRCRLHLRAVDHATKMARTCTKERCNLTQSGCPVTGCWSWSVIPGCGQYVAARRDNDDNDALVQRSVG